ncbi:M20 family metallopeptidase [Ideonella sp. DXS22W]|uniref:M20 family metallopeptidase n=1 Tax=Pseudaquabacterium inlustre TaxID=2984192 RepID=A0ABU9CQI5_9BURK
MSRTQLLDDAAATIDDGRFQALLARRVACRTESDRPDADPAQLAAYLQHELMPGLQAMGFSGRLIDNPSGQGGPMLIARREEDPALPTVLSYGHGDVVSGQDARWGAGRSPWQLSCEGPRWYGRGTADNKGQHTISLLALAAALAARGGRLGYNVTLLIETGEEAGSPGLRALCERERDGLLRADLLIACDGPRVQAERPTLFLGSRGAVNLRLRASRRGQAYHSGNWGGVLANPAQRLAAALATLVDAHGRIQVPGLRPPAPSAQIRAALAEVPVGGDPDDPTLDADWGEPGLSPAERLYAWNTLEVLALGAGQPQRPVNAIPADAVAQLQLRFVVGTDWLHAEAHVRTHLLQAGFDDITVERGMSCAATRLDLGHAWVRWAAGSIQASCGQPPVLLPNLAGSLPNDLFADVLGLPTLWVPHSYPACAQHAPDEHLLLPIAREGLRIMAGLWWDLGEPDAPWPAPLLP